jgi:hypothetical protein
MVQAYTSFVRMRELVLANSSVLIAIEGKLLIWYELGVGWVKKRECCERTDQLRNAFQ